MEGNRWSLDRENLGMIPSMDAHGGGPSVLQPGDSPGPNTPTSERTHKSTAKAGVLKNETRQRTCMCSFCCFVTILVVRMVAKLLGPWSFTALEMACCEDAELAKDPTWPIAFRCGITEIGGGGTGAGAGAGTTEAELVGVTLLFMLCIMLGSGGRLRWRDELRDTAPGGTTTWFCWPLGQLGGGCCWCGW